jgi:hypothetical protein
MNGWQQGPYACDTGFDPCAEPACQEPPAQCPLPRYQGDDWQFPINYLQPNGQPFDLTGYTVGAQLFVRGSIDPPIVLEGAAGSATIVSTTGGAILVVVAASLTETVPLDPGFNDAGATRVQIWLIDSDGLRSTLVVYPIFVRGF